MVAIAGAVILLVASNSVANFSSFILPFTAGGFIYIAGCDLLPEIQREREVSTSVVQLLALVSGVGLMYLLMLVG